MKDSSFAAEARGWAFRVIMECSTPDRGKGQVHHWCDNEGVVKVSMSNATEAKSILREQKSCRHLFAELDARV